MPVKKVSFLIPIDKKVESITIDSVSVQQLAGTYAIYPVQTPVPTSVSISSVPFDDPDTAIYNHSTPYPAIRYEIVNDGYPMGYHVITLTFYPLEYIPSDSILNLYSEIYFTLHYVDNPDDVLVPVMQSKYANDIAKDYIKSLVSNDNDIYTVLGGPLEVVNNGTPVSHLKSMIPSTLIHIPDYIIITNDSLKASFQRLADWKTQKGIYTIVVAVEDIYYNYQGYDNAEKIRNYLKDVYVNYGSSFVLLGGDVDNVPTKVVWFRIKYGSTSQDKVDVFYETNHYYATVQGNWNADGDNLFGEDSDNADSDPVFYVGRAPIHNNLEANVFINKVIGYEKLNNTPNKNYVQNLSLWIGRDGGNFPFDALNLIDKTGIGFLNPANYFVLKLYDDYLDHISEIQYQSRYFQLNSMNVIESMNQGWYNFNQDYGKIHLIYHCDHSGFDAMGTSTRDLKEHIFRSDMNALLNGIEYAQILYTDGCQPNQFSKDAISEVYINNPNGGGVAFLGNVDDGGWNDYRFFTDYFCKALYDLNKPDPYINTHFYLGNLNLKSTNNSGYVL